MHEGTASVASRSGLFAMVVVPIRELVRRTRLSLAYCRQIKRGLVVPHPMWWERLQGSTPTS